MVKEQYPDATKAVSTEVIPRWLTNLEALIRSDPSSTLSQPSFGQAEGEVLALHVQAWTVSGTQ
jgi:hypothetical protein